MKLAFIGCGKLGQPASEYIESHGYKMNRVDIGDSIKDGVKDCTFVFVAVPTPHDPHYDGKYPCSHLPPKDFDYTILKDVIEEANKYMTQDQCLVVVSTVLPGTIRKQIAPLVTNTNLLYNPYLIAMGTVKADMEKPEMIMIGGNIDWASKLIHIYEKICFCKRYVTGTWEECEAVKIFYNTFITTKITLVNMIQDVAEKLGNMDSGKVARALAESEKRIMSPMYMKPGMGDGGACHPRDNIALRYLAQDLDLGYDMFDTIINAREKQAQNMADEILNKGVRIQFSSDSFKPGTDITDGSYSLLVQHYIKEMGGKIVDENPHVYVLVHPGDKRHENNEVINFDPWDEYGNTR